MSKISLKTGTLVHRRDRKLTKTTVWGQQISHHDRWLIYLLDLRLLGISCFAQDFVWDVPDSVWHGQEPSPTLWSSSGRSKGSFSSPLGSYALQTQNWHPDGCSPVPPMFGEHIHWPICSCCDQQRWRSDCLLREEYECLLGWDSVRSCGTWSHKIWPGISSEGNGGWFHIHHNSSCAFLRFWYHNRKPHPARCNRCFDI